MSLFTASSEKTLNWKKAVLAFADDLIRDVDLQTEDKLANASRSSLVCSVCRLFSKNPSKRALKNHQTAVDQIHRETNVCPINEQNRNALRDRLINQIHAWRNEFLAGRETRYVLLDVIPDASKMSLYYYSSAIGPYTRSVARRVQNAPNNAADVISKCSKVSVLRGQDFECVFQLVHKNNSTSEHQNFGAIELNDFIILYTMAHGQSSLKLSLHIEQDYTFNGCELSTSTEDFVTAIIHSTQANLTGGWRSPTDLSKLLIMSSIEELDIKSSADADAIIWPSSSEPARFIWSLALECLARALPRIFKLIEWFPNVTTFKLTLGWYVSEAAKNRSLTVDISNWAQQQLRRTLEIRDYIDYMLRIILQLNGNVSIVVMSTGPYKLTIRGRFRLETMDISAEQKGRLNMISSVKWVPCDHETTTIISSLRVIKQIGKSQFRTIFNRKLPNDVTCSKIVAVPIFTVQFDLPPGVPYQYEMCKNPTAWDGVTAIKQGTCY